MKILQTSVLFAVALYSQPLFANDLLLQAWNRIEAKVAERVQQSYRPSPAPFVDSVLEKAIANELAFDVAALSPSERSEKWRKLTMLRDACKEREGFYELSIKLDLMARNVLNWPEKQVDVSSVRIEMDEGIDSVFRRSGLRMSDSSLRFDAMSAFRLALGEELAALSPKLQAKLLQYIANYSEETPMPISEKISRPLIMHNEWSNFHSEMVFYVFDLIVKRADSVEGVAALTVCLSNRSQNRKGHGFREMREFAANELRQVADRDALARGMYLGLQALASEYPEDRGARFAVEDIARGLRLKLKAPSAKPRFPAPSLAAPSSREPRPAQAKEKAWHQRIPGVAAFCEWFLKG